jgi:hypothetical protein
MSFLSGLTKGFASLAIPPPAGNQASLAQAYNPDAYDEQLLLQQIADEINAMPIPGEWKRYYLGNFKSEFVTEQVARPSLIKSQKTNGIEIGPLTMRSVLLNIKHPCFKARVRAMMKRESEKYKEMEDDGLAAEDISRAKEASMKMFLKELINGFATHTDYDLDKNGLPTGARNSRAFQQYGRRPPEGCNLPKSPRYVGGKHKTNKRKIKKRKTKKRVSKKYA